MKSKTFTKTFTVALPKHFSDRELLREVAADKKLLAGIRTGDALVVAKRKTVRGGGFTRVVLTIVKDEY